MSALHGLLGLLQQSVKVGRIVLALDGAWARLICGRDKNRSVCPQDNCLPSSTIVGFKSRMNQEFLVIIVVGFTGVFNSGAACLCRFSSTQVIVIQR